VEIFAVGDVVTGNLKVLREDKAATDDRNLFALITEISRDGLYRLHTTYGTINRCYHTSALIRLSVSASKSIKDITD